MGPTLWLGEGAPRVASKRHKPEEVVSKLRRAEVLIGQGVARAVTIGEVSVTERTDYRLLKQ